MYAQRFVEMLNEPVFAKYADFKEFLDHLSVATCQGCRKENASCLKPVMFVHAARRSKWIIASSVAAFLVRIQALMSIYTRDL